MINPLLSIIEEDARSIIDKVDLKELAGKTLLLTGASGLIGTYLLACLRALTIEHGMRALTTAVVHSELKVPTELLIDFDGVEVVRGDICELEFIKRLGRFDYIVHAAGYGQPDRFLRNQVETIKINTWSTLALFDKLNAGGKFLFISSSELYSGLPNPPYKEDQIGATNTTHSRSCYIEGKRCGEAICNAYRVRGVNASSARLALAYGPGTKSGDRRVLNAFIERGIALKRIMLQDTGSARRTYCYVSDATEILWAILLNGTAPIYNVGGNSRTTIAGLAKRVGEYLNVPVEFPANAMEMGGAPEDVCLDMSLVERDFGKTQYVPFEVGLQRTIEWQQALYSVVK